MAKRQAVALRPAPKPESVPAVALGRASWSRASDSATVAIDGHRLDLVTDATPAGKVMSQAFRCPIRWRSSGSAGTIDGGPIAIGLLNDTRERRLLTRTYDAGPFDDLLVCESGVLAAKITPSSSRRSMPASR